MQKQLDLRRVTHCMDFLYGEGGGMSEGTGLNTKVMSSVLNMLSLRTL